MKIDIKSPTFPESIVEGTVAKWFKKKGDSIFQDEVIVGVETDKVILDVVASADGILTKIIKKEGEVIGSSEVIGEFIESSNDSQSFEDKEDLGKDIKMKSKDDDSDVSISMKSDQRKLGPAARKMLSENNLLASEVKSIKNPNRISKSDILNYLESGHHKSLDKQEVSSSEFLDSTRPEKRVPMTRLRDTIARRLLSVSQETAMLTTFNEVDMSSIKNLRSNYGKDFEKTHGVKLGFMGFFIIAVVNALKKFPTVNASIDGSDIVYHGYQDIGVAVSTARGLVVPIIKDSDIKSLVEIERSIIDYSEKARDGKLSIEEMQGGTFTISNGGVFGSLLSTPILNAPQTAILGMHTIQDRPIAEDGKVVIRPMMYLALSYDHRLLDGKEAVSFLVLIKEQLESPERFSLNL